MCQLKLMRKVKVVSGAFCRGLVGRIIQINSSPFLLYCIRFNGYSYWFFADELQIANAQDVITKE